MGSRLTIPKIIRVPLFAHNPLGVLLEKDGVLVQYRGDRMLEDRPVRVIRYGVSKIPVSDWPELVGIKPWQPSGSAYWGGTVRIGWGDHYVSCDEWDNVEVEVPIEAPRNGRTYYYAWRCLVGAGWYPKWYSNCGYCGDPHAPELPYCQTCYRCHKSKCKAAA